MSQSFQGFSTVISARVHEKRHEATKDYCCPVCGKTFSVKGNLQKHMILHEGTRSYICDLCGNAYKDPDGLKAHMKRHGEKKFACDMCELKFHSISTYKNHRMGCVRQSSSDLFH